MTSVKFEGYTQAIAEDQEEYQTVYAHVGTSNQFPSAKVITTCYQLSPEELKALLENGGQIWYQQLCFDEAMTPMSLHINKPLL